MQIEPAGAETRNIFLNVLTAQESSETTAPEATYRTGKAGEIEVIVDGASTRLAVPEWFAPPR